VQDSKFWANIDTLLLAVFRNISLRQSGDGRLSAARLQTSMNYVQK